MEKGAITSQGRGRGRELTRETSSVPRVRARNATTGQLPLSNCNATYKTHPSLRLRVWTTPVSK